MVSGSSPLKMATIPSSSSGLENSPNQSPQNLPPPVSTPPSTTTHLPPFPSPSHSRPLPYASAPQPHQFTSPHFTSPRPPFGFYSQQPQLTFSQPSPFSPPILPNVSHSFPIKLNDANYLFSRQRTLHQIIGGGFVADVILWRRKNLTLGILLITLAIWLLFETCGYTLLSLLSSVLLLLVTIIFLWAKSASILNRPAPPLPELHLSKDMVNEAAAFIRSHVNTFLSVSQDMAMGKNPRLFFKVAACLWLISVISGLTDLTTLGYTSLLLVLTVPALYEKYEEYVDRHVILIYRKLHQFYVKLDEKRVLTYQQWILESEKLS